MADVRQYAGGGPETQNREWSIGEIDAQIRAQMLKQAQRDSIGRQMGATLQSQLGASIGQTSRGEPSKAFTRSDILAIIRGQTATAHHPETLNVLNHLRIIFENLE